MVWCYGESGVGQFSSLALFQAAVVISHTGLLYVASHKGCCKATQRYMAEPCYRYQNAMEQKQYDCAFK